MENPALCLVPGSLAETGRPTRPSTLKVAPGLAGIRRIEGCLQTVDTFLRCSAQAAQMQNHTGLPSLPLHGRVELHYSTIPYFSNGRLHLSQHLIEFCLTKDPYGPRHSTILSDIIRLCLKSVLGKVVLDVQNLQHCLGFSHALHCAGPVLLQINADLQREIWKKSLPTGPSEPPKFHICH